MASNMNYIYRQKANWVVIEKASSKEVPLGSFKHPVNSINVNEMEAMMLSIKIDRKYLLKKEIETVDVFNSFEARKFAAFFVEALAKLDNDSVVNFAIIHKRPIFILQNDRISTGNLWVSDDGVHFQFSKLFAKIEGDYESSVNMDKSLRKAKTTRVSLAATPGQKLSYNSPTEIILEPTHDFISQTTAERADDQVAENQVLKGSKSRGNVSDDAAESSIRTARPVASKPSGSVADRLKQLDNLKAQKLVTDAEYQKLRQKILSDI